MGLPNLAVLQQEVANLGLTLTQKGKRPSKDDCVRLLKEYYLKRDFPTGTLPYEEITPMLCFAEWNLKPEEQKALWEDNNAWVAQRKLNGCRIAMHFIKGVGIFAHGRNISVQTYRFEEYSDHFTFKGEIPDFTASIDTEIIVEKPIDTAGYTTNRRQKPEKTQSSLHSTSALMALDAAQSVRLQKDQGAHFTFKTFDIMKVGAGGGIVDLRQMRLLDRMRYLRAFEKKIGEVMPQIAQFFEYPEVVRVGKRAFWDKVVKEEGGEGLVFKNLNSTYIDSTSRRRDAWVKAKKRIEYDAFVVGFERGDTEAGYRNLVGNLEFGIYVGNAIHVIGRPSNMTMEERRRITIYDPATDTVTMDPSMYGRVAEISGQDISAREMRLSHCTLDRWRPETGPDAKRKEDCVTTMADLKAACEWVG